jgi:hypothetical protein
MIKILRPLYAILSAMIQCLVTVENQCVETIRFLFALRLNFRVDCVFTWKSGFVHL